VAGQRPRALYLDAVVPDGDVDGGSGEAVVAVSKGVQHRLAQHGSGVLRDRLAVRTDDRFIAAGPVIDLAQDVVDELRQWPGELQATGYRAGPGTDADAPHDLDGGCWHHGGWVAGEEQHSGANEVSVQRRICDLGDTEVDERAHQVATRGLRPTVRLERPIDQLDVDPVEIEPEDRLGFGCALLTLADKAAQRISDQGEVVATDASQQTSVRGCDDTSADLGDGHHAQRCALHGHLGCRDVDVTCLSGTSDAVECPLVERCALDLTSIADPDDEHSAFGHAHRGDRVRQVVGRLFEVKALVLHPAEQLPEPVDGRSGRNVGKAWDPAQHCEASYANDEARKGTHAVS